MRGGRRRIPPHEPAGDRRQYRFALAQRRTGPGTGIDEPFYFTSADEKAIARFVETARESGFDARQGDTFWHFSSRCDTARAVRTLSQLFRDATHIKLNLVGIGAGEQDSPWLRVVNQALILPPNPAAAHSPKAPVESRALHGHRRRRNSWPGRLERSNSEYYRAVSVVPVLFAQEPIFNSWEFKGTFARTVAVLLHSCLLRNFDKCHKRIDFRNFRSLHGSWPHLCHHETTHRG